MALGEAIGADILELAGTGHGVELNPGRDTLMTEITAWVESVAKA